MATLTKTGSESLTKTERNVGFDVLKTLATLGVVILHSASIEWKEISYATYEWNILNIYDSAVRWVVPVFVMISGAIFLNADFTIERIYKKYISRIVTAFIFWSALYACYEYFDEYEHSLKVTVLSFFKGHFHLWYLYMIVGLYMIVPLVKKIIADEKLIRYFLVISFIFSFLIPELVYVMTNIPLTAMVGKYAKIMIRNMYLDFVGGYTFYFIIGYYFTKIKLNAKQYVMMGAFCFFGILSTAVLTYKFSHILEKNCSEFYSFTSVNVLFQALFVFSLYQLINKIPFSPGAKSVILKLSKYSFGVYLVHDFFILISDKFFHFNSITINPILGVPAVAAITFVGAYIVSAILNHIPILKKYIV